MPGNIVTSYELSNFTTLYRSSKLVLSSHLSGHLNGLLFLLLVGDVDLCLVPEMLIDLNGENGILKFLKSRVARQGNNG